MIKLIYVYCMSAFVVDGCLRHIQSLNFMVSGSIFTHTNKLNSSLGQGPWTEGWETVREERSSPCCMLETGGRDILSAGQTEGRKTF